MGVTLITRSSVAVWVGSPRPVFAQAWRRHTPGSATSSRGNTVGDLSPTGSEDLESRPLVSIVTPSYNHAGFLESTIRSVLSQDYPRIEYLVCDGGSKDASVDIIKRYSTRLAWWCSETDRGQSHAINKGWGRSTGEIVAHLNFEALLLPCGVHA